MTQHQLVIEYVREHGSILPAKMAGFIYKGQMLGSETSKRCRELRNQIQGKWCNSYGKQMLVGVKEGKFERFYLVGQVPQPVIKDLSPTAKEFFKDFPINKPVIANALF